MYVYPSMCMHTMYGSVKYRSLLPTNAHILTGNDDDEHLGNLEAVLKQLREAGLRANLDKYFFFEQKVKYCGHEVSGKGLWKLPTKATAILESPAPENTLLVHSFLVLVNYCQRFLPGFSTVMHPLNALLQRGVTFCWTDTCQTTFDRVK